MEILWVGNEVSPDAEEVERRDRVGEIEIVGWQQIECGFPTVTEVTRTSCALESIGELMKVSSAVRSVAVVDPNQVGLSFDQLEIVIESAFNTRPRMMHDVNEIGRVQFWTLRLHRTKNLSGEIRNAAFSYPDKIFPRIGRFDSDDLGFLA